jgi:hypothetical protein
MIFRGQRCLMIGGLVDDSLALGCRGVAGRACQPHESVFGYFGDMRSMIRGNRWKLIHYPLLGRERLFDLMNDPLDLARKAEHDATRPAAAP